MPHHSIIPYHTIIPYHYTTPFHYTIPSYHIMSRPNIPYHTIPLHHLLRPVMSCHVMTNSILEGEKFVLLPDDPDVSPHIHDEPIFVCRHVDVWKVGSSALFTYTTTYIHTPFDTNLMTPITPPSDPYTPSPHPLSHNPLDVTHSLRSTHPLPPPPPFFHCWLL